MFIRNTRPQELNRMKPHAQNIHGNGYASHGSKASLDILERFFNMIFDMIIKNWQNISFFFARRKT